MGPAVDRLRLQDATLRDRRLEAPEGLGERARARAQGVLEAQARGLLARLDIAAAQGVHDADQHGRTADGLLR